MTSPAEQLQARAAWHGIKIVPRDDIKAAAA